MTRRLALPLWPVLALLVACGGNDGVTPPGNAELQAVRSEVVHFEFTSDTGNASSRLRYRLSFTNPNPVEVRGGWRITLDTDGLVTQTVSSSTSPCTAIAAASVCIYDFDEEQSFDIGRIRSITVLSLEWNFRP